MARNDPWSDHPKTRFWAYLSSYCINPNLAYVTYFESPFGSNADTWAKEFLPRENKNQWLMPILLKINSSILNKVQVLKHVVKQ